TRRRMMRNAGSPASRPPASKLIRASTRPDRGQGGGAMGANFGIGGLEWQHRINWDRMRRYRLERARERMQADELGPLRVMYEEMQRHGVAGEKLGVDFIDINMLKVFEEKRITWVDGMTPMMEARAVKNVDEQECMRIVGAIGDATHWECMKFLRPGITENQVTAHLMKYLYNIPGMEDVEDVIVSSGPNTWPNWRNFSDRIIQPGDIVFMDLAALTWNGYKSCYYRTYCVGKEPSQEQKDVYATALKWLYDSIGAVKAGTTTREIASKWPSAKEAYGYQKEDQAAANLWGHGLGLAQYDPPVISRIWSLDHPIEIKSGMVFALETQHGKMFRWGVRIEEMLIVHDDRIEI